ncbi:MAG: hypothetical protein K2W84_15660 [Burkholderiales bacterium]|nr:hypothetical protein [Burkholderiales bacterium]
MFFLRCVSLHDRDEVDDAKSCNTLKSPTQINADHFGVAVFSTTATQWSAAGPDAAATNPENIA